MNNSTPTTPEQETPDLREQLAVYAHEARSGWMEYLFNRCGTFNDDGSFTITAPSVERWVRQSTTSYVHLPESEKESDRDEADKMLALLPELSTLRTQLTAAQQERDEARQERDIAKVQRNAEFAGKQALNAELTTTRTRLSQMENILRRAVDDQSIVDIINESIEWYADASKIVGHTSGLSDSYKAHYDAMPLSEELQVLPVAEVGETDGGWIRVEERLPELDTAVHALYDIGHGPVLATAMRYYAIGDDDEDSGWRWSFARQGWIYVNRPNQGDFEDDDDYPVTHWRPLPPTPAPTATDDSRQDDYRAGWRQVCLAVWYALKNERVELIEENHG